MLFHDLSVLKLTNLPAIAHDSLLFPYISDRNLCRLLQLYSKETDKQIFISFDHEENYGKETTELLQKYGKIYTASITLTASEGYVFAESTTVTVNGNPATSVTKNANGTLTVTYAFPATDKYNIETTVDTDVRDGDAAKNPTISSGYEIEYCFFVEDTDKDGVFINKTGDSITFDDKTLVVDKALVEAYAAQSGGRFTYESLMAALKGEFDLDELKTEFTGGYDYSVLAYIYHSDNAYFDYDDNQIVTNAIVKVNGKKITDNIRRPKRRRQNQPARFDSAAQASCKMEH